MWRSPLMPYLSRRWLTGTVLGRDQIVSTSYSTMVQASISNDRTSKMMTSSESHFQILEQSTGGRQKLQIGDNVSRKDKLNFLITTLREVKDSKETVYGALDAWVAWEQKFPIASLKTVIITFEKEQQWHRVVQVIKWILSKGQGNTMGTYGQLIRALDMDHRANEAHEFWMKKIGVRDLHSVPWQLCKTMISVYYRNNMLEKLVRLFKGLESYDRKPQEKVVVQRVADAYEMLGLPQEKERILEKYKDLFNFSISVGSFSMSSVMTSSVHGLSDNNEADEQQKQNDSQIQSSTPVTGVIHPGIASPNAQYSATPQLGPGHAMAPPAYPYPDPYYRSIFTPYDAQPYTPQPYAGQPMVHLQLMGIQQAGVPLPSDAVEEPVFVNAKQYHGILRRRQSRAKAELESKAKSRKPYLHESRHLHAVRRARGCGGRFLNSKKDENQENEMTSSGAKSQPNINLNSDKTGLPSSNSSS